MRFAAVLATALLLSGCAWVKQQVPWNTPPIAAPTPSPKPSEPAKPAEPPKPEVQHPPHPHDDHPDAAPQLRGDVAPPESDAQHQARCRTMADNRAADARGLGASTADQARMRSETFSDCMQGAVK